MLPMNIMWLRRAVERSGLHSAVAAALLSRLEPLVLQGWTIVVEPEDGRVQVRMENQLGDYTHWSLRNGVQVDAQIKWIEQVLVSPMVLLYKQARERLDHLELVGALRARAINYNDPTDVVLRGAQALVEVGLLTVNDHEWLNENLKAAP